MDNNKIINLDGGIDNNDAVNMEQFNSIKTRFDEQVPYMKNNIYNDNIHLPVFRFQCKQ